MLRGRRLPFPLLVSLTYRGIRVTGDDARQFIDPGAGRRAAPVHAQPRRRRPVPLIRWYPRRMIDDHEIVPGERIGPFRLGAPAGPQLERLAAASPVEEVRDDVRVYETRDVTLFVEHGAVTQVGVHGEHPGQTDSGLRLGMTLDEVKGPIFVDTFNEVLVLAGVPGLCFTTDRDLGPLVEDRADDPVELPRGDRISWIGVFAPDEEDEEDEIVEVLLR
jgi:hypothetical protein